MGNLRVGLNLPDRWQQVNDILLRPTDQKPGFYDTDEGIVPVVNHEGRPHTMLFFDKGEGYKHLQEGDTLFLGCYPKSQTITYPEGSPMIQGMTIESAEIPYKHLIEPE